MSLQVEKLEKNMAKLTIEAGADELEKAIEKAYQKQKNQIRNRRTRSVFRASERVRFPARWWRRCTAKRCFMRRQPIC